MRDRLLQSVDEFNRGFRIYLKRGKIAYLTAQLLTVCFFCSRFAVAYFILLGLGLPVTPHTFVTIGPPIVQVILVQVLLNFALYLSPTPGASGVAEAGSSAIMSPWVQPPFVIAYLVLWRVLSLFLCMFVGESTCFATSEPTCSSSESRTPKPRSAPSRPPDMPAGAARSAVVLAVIVAAAGCDGCGPKRAPPGALTAVVQDF